MTAVSTSPTAGTAALARMIGHAWRTTAARVSGSVDPAKAALQVGGVRGYHAGRRRRALARLVLPRALRPDRVRSHRQRTVGRAFHQYLGALARRGGDAGEVEQRQEMLGGGRGERVVAMQYQAGGVARTLGQQLLCVCIEARVPVES